MLADRASTLGAVFHEAEVRSISVAGDRPASLHCSDGHELQLDGTAVIIAAGAHSKGLAADVGCDVALDTERGYHVEIADPNITLNRPVLVSDGAFFASMMQGRLGLAGTVELAGLRRQPDWRLAARGIELWCSNLSTPTSSCGKRSISSYAIPCCPRCLAFRAQPARAGP
ncbi:NAD(P)/FAD-dependent oxidoreductase [Variovorax fucosicus]|uniref:NAD(P)/FAD-dependent oxidoreductase n=1 Tax=Variovorax fucosicus TaxID=3053517 RepID=UPI0033655E6E